MLAAVLAEIRGALRRLREAEASGVSSPRGQAVVFLQDRQALRALADAIPDEPTLVAERLQPPRDTTATLSSDTLAASRRRLLEPTTGDAFQLILVTSSGARGIDVSLATELIAVVPGSARGPAHGGDCRRRHPRPRDRRGAGSHGDRQGSVPSRSALSKSPGREISS